jgi:hypothetical protein
MPQIDLSAGLQPKPNVDLSAGFVPQDGPTISALPSKQAKPGFFGSVSQENTGESNPLHFLGVNLPEQAGKILQHPLRALGIGAKSDYEGVTDAAKGEYDAMKDSASEGHYGDAAAHFLHYLGSPLFGTAPHRAAEKLNVGDVRGGLGTTVGVTLPFLINPAGAEGVQAIGHEATNVVKGAADLSKEGVSQVKQAINPVKNMTAEQAAIKAVRPRNSKANFPQELSTALPDTRRALDKAGVDASNMTLQDALDAAHQAKKDVWAELKANHPNANLRADTTLTADSMRSTVSNRMRTQNPALAKRIERAASEYDGASMSLDEIEDRVKELNNQTRAIEAKYVTDKAAAKQSPKNAYLFAERDALKTLLLSKLDEATGPGAANLRKRYGNLTSFQDVVSRRIPVAERQAPVTLPGLIGKVYGPAKIAAGTGKLLVGNPGGLHDIFEGTVAMKGARDAARLNDPDTLISHAFSKTQPTPQPQLSGPTLPFLPSPAPQVPATTGPAFLRNLAQQGESLQRNPALDKVLSKSGFTPKGYAPEEYNFNGERMYEFQGPTGSEVILPESQITPERLKTTFSPEPDLEQARRGAPTPPVEVPAVNQVPKEQRASNQIVNEAQQQAAQRIEGRTEQKKALEEPKAQAAAVGSTEPKIVGYAAHDHKPIIEIRSEVSKGTVGPDEKLPTDAMAIFNKRFYQVTGTEIPEDFWNDMTPSKLQAGFAKLGLDDEIFKEANGALYDAGYRQIGNIGVTKDGVRMPLQGTE